MARWCELVNRLQTSLDYLAIRFGGFTLLHRWTMSVLGWTGSSGNGGVGRPAKGGLSLETYSFHHMRSFPHLVYCMVHLSSLDHPHPYVSSGGCLELLSWSGDH